MGFIERDGRIGNGFRKFNKGLLLFEGVAVVATAGLGLMGVGLAAALHAPLVGGLALDVAGTPAVESAVLKNSNSGRAWIFPQRSQVSKRAA